MIGFALHKTTSDVAYCALSIRTGTRDEGDLPGGLAHFTEHLLFKGTTRRSASSINSRIERLGGDLNAYTTKEETVIHATVLCGDLPKAVSLLFELAFDSVFPQKEIDKERGVILEEISSYKDSPAEQIFDDFEEYLYEGTPLSTPVLGKAISLKRINRETLLDYYHSRFVPENMVFTAVANIDERKLRSMVERNLAKWSAVRVSPAPQCPVRKMLDIGDGNVFEKTSNRKSHQAHCIIGATAYSYNNPKRVALFLLSNLLGGPAANSMLNTLLRERNALVYGVESSFTQFCDTGCVAIYFGCDKANLQRCISLVHKTLAKLRDETLSERVLAASKKQLLGQMAISEDNGEAQVLSMGKSLLSFGRVIPNAEVVALINAVTARQIKEVAEDVFRPSRLSTLVYK